MPKLVFHDSDGIDKTIPLGTEPITIGRASDCEIQTHDAMVSRRHARITWDGSYWIEDLGSSNGVFLGPDKVQRAPFRPGDVVTCGSLVVRMMPDTRRPNSMQMEDMPAPRAASSSLRAGELELPRTRRPSQSMRNDEFEAELRTSASPALAGSAEAAKLKLDLRRETERREQAEAALLQAEEKAANADQAARELLQLRRRVEQLQSDLRRAHDGEPPESGPAVDLDEVAEAAAVFNDALAGLKASLRAAVDEAELLTSPTPSVRVVRESMRSAMDELARAKDRLREMVKKLGLRQG
jgi:pSer/pThr/pTyr-binding forkhead associated (FHA) protein